MIIRNARVEDLADVVNIHKVAFNDFFLTKLGDKFLYQYYKMYIDNDEIILVAVNDRGKVIGFICGLDDSSNFYHEMKIKWYKFLSLQFFLKALKIYNIVFKKIISIFTTNKINHVNYPKYSNELTSVSVTSEYIGYGIGKQLLTEYILKVRENNKSKNIVLTTDFFDNDNVINFYKKNGFNIHTNFCQSANRKMLVLIKKI